MDDAHFGHWLAGFVDGEGCFYIARLSHRPLGYSPRFSLSVRADDADIVEYAQKWTGLGTTHYYTATTGSRIIRWVVQSHSDCAALVSLFTEYPLRAKKQRDFQVWSEAVAVAAQVKLGRGKDNSEITQKLASLKDRLAQARIEGITD